MACPPLRKRPRRAARGSLVAAGFSHMPPALPKESREGAQPCCIDQQEEETAMATDEELREQAIKAWRSTRGTPTAATPTPSADGDRLDLHAHVLGQARHLHRGARREGLAEVLRVHLVDGAEVVHVLQEDGGLHHVLQAEAGGGQYQGEVVESLVCLILGCVAHDLALGVQGELARHEDEVAGAYARRIRSHRWGRVC